MVLSAKHDLCIIVGAKNSQRLSSQLAAISADRYVIIEGDESVAMQVKEQVNQDNQKVEVLNTYVTPTGGNTTLYRYNLSEFDGFEKATGLHELFPNLNVRSEETVDTQALPDLIKTIHVNENAYDKSAVLVINSYAQTNRLLASLEDAKQLARFNRLHLASTSSKLFAGSKDSDTQSEWLLAHGFKQATALYTNDDPDFPMLDFVEDKTVKALEQAQIKNSQLKQALDIEKANQSKLENKLAEAETDKTKLTKKISELEQALKALKDEHNRLDELAEQVSKQVLQGVNSASHNATRQLISFIGIQHRLDGRGPTLDLNGPDKRSIRNDLALHLLELILLENFDAVIEFGCGTSTVLLARALKLNNSAQDNGQSSPPQNNKVTSFEHSSYEVNRVVQQLSLHEAEAYADLVHCPLVDWEHEEKSYLHYDCSDKLEELQASFKGKPAKLLILVNGPGSEICEHARFPAMPKVLQHLGENQLHVVFPDYVSAEERTAAARWSKLFDAAGLQTEKAALQLERNAFSWILNRI